MFGALLSALLEKACSMSSTPGHDHTRLTFSEESLDLLDLLLGKSLGGVLELAGHAAFSLPGPPRNNRK